MASTLPMARAASFALAAALLMAGCTEKVAAPSAPAAPAPLVQATPLLDVMRAAVEIPADGIWAAQAAEKLSDDEWLLADQDSAALAASATLMSMPGTGKNDRMWTANADWQGWSKDIQTISLQLRAAAKAKDQMKFNAMADQLTATCEACHAKYRPETPSDGVARYPFYPARTLPKPAS